MKLICGRPSKFLIWLGGNYLQAALERSEAIDEIARLRASLYTIACDPKVNEREEMIHLASESWCKTPMHLRKEGR